MIEKRECVIIGGGPSGLAASIEAAQLGVSVLLIDENKSPGGQLFKQIHKFFGSSEHNAGMRGYDIGKQLLQKTEELGIEVWLDSAVIGIFEDKKISVLKAGKTIEIIAQRLIICTGGAENPLNFPGWTLPGVMGAGAIQTMINVNRVLPGKRVLMIGSGNVGVIVAYQLLQSGADVVGIVEAAPRIGAYGVHAAKVRRAGVPFYLSHTIDYAIGNECVDHAVIVQLDNNMQKIPNSRKSIGVDVISIAAGLRPLAELSFMAGVEHSYIPALGGWMPIHNEDMETSVEGIYVAGDTAGVEEANTAMDEGRLAGVSVAYSLGYLADSVSNTKKSEIRNRLSALRQGPFGNRRFEAKKKITRR